MASLSSGNHGADPQMSFNLEFLGYKKFDGKASKDWLEARIWLEVFGQKLQLPGKSDIDIHDTKGFIKWMRELPSISVPMTAFQTFHEPLFTITANSNEDGTYEITTLVSAYGTVAGF